jgi:hypothetical protein
MNGVDFDKVFHDFNQLSVEPHEKSEDIDYKLTQLEIYLAEIKKLCDIESMSQLSNENNVIPEMMIDEHSENPIQETDEWDYNWEDQTFLMFKNKDDDTCSHCFEPESFCEFFTKEEFD